MIGPVKEEDEWDQPRIVRYHDIVSDSDMEKVKELAKPRVSPSIIPPRLETQSWWSHGAQSWSTTSTLLVFQPSLPHLDQSTADTNLSTPR